MLKNIKEDKNKICFEIHGTHNVCFANALRRAIMCDIETVAPGEVHITHNSTCQTNEYIAHRIGLIPFEKNIDPNTVMTINVSDRDVYTSDIKGYHKDITPNICIMKMIPEQSLVCEIRMNKSKGSVHARYSHVSAVGFKHHDDHISMSFDVITKDRPYMYLKDALASIHKRLLDTLYQIERDHSTQINAPILPGAKPISS